MEPGHGAATRGRGLVGWRRSGSATSFLIIVAAALAVAAPAAADQIQPRSIGQVQVNGAAPNSDGSGLQTAASLAAPAGGSASSTVLTVTNKSSSYTDVKEIDGVGNDAGYQPIKSATSDGHPCTVAGAGGGSFSCPGFSIPPGQSVSITITYPTFTISDGTGSVTYDGAGLASVNVVYDTVEINGSPMDPHGKGLQVKALVTQGNCPEFVDLERAWCLNIVNSPDNGGPVSSIVIAPNPPPAGGSAGQVQTIIPPIGGAFDVGTDPAGICGTEAEGLYCEAYFGLSAFELNFTDPSFASGLGLIDVGFMSTPCLKSANASRANFGPAVARAAEANCTPPSRTKITTAKINQKKHTAFFKFTAKGTKKFTCVLTRNGKDMFAHACHSPKPYASKLPKGKYVFTVGGINKGGVDPHPAKKKFQLK
jgi:hypothetical protein